MLPPLSCQRDLFPLADHDAYLNGAARSPQLKAGAAAARHALHFRETHSGMPIEDFFGPVRQLREEFARLIDCDDPHRTAILPSTSYGIATVARNLPLSAGQNIIIVRDQFPSNYYSWSRLCRERSAELRIVDRPTDGRSWTDAVCAAIDDSTAAVAIAHVHWADGTLFDLGRVRRGSGKVGAWLVVDGTQSVGALPFSVRDLQPDALVCGAYKWLMGPYGSALAYFGPRMDDGVPIEENWINRRDSHDFRRLVDYREEYQPGAGRYCVGQHSNFITVPMLIAGLQQLNAWGMERIQEYTGRLWAEVTDSLADLGITLADQRANHLVGLTLPPSIDPDRLTRLLEADHLTISFRGDSLRVSPNVYNRPDEMHRLVTALRASVSTPAR